jgi:LmbE family N-acetylglucosaminyl deacetylase
MEPSRQAFSSLTPKVVLGIAAHPDDLDFSASGTLATYAAGGAAVYYLQLTDGGKGSSNASMSAEQVSKLRQAEQQAACNCVSGQEVFFLNYPDGELEISRELKKEIVRYIRKLKPDVVITTDPNALYYPEWGMINHNDHRAAGQAALDAVYPLARDHLTFPELASEGLTPHKVKTVLLTAFSNQDFFVDVSHVMAQKMAAVAAHASQLSDPEQFKSKLIEMAAKNGEKAGVEYAEGFIRLEIMV